MNILAIDKAIQSRQKLAADLLLEETDCYRMFHGISEGIPGLTIDRYGPLVLAQTFRDPLSSIDIAELQEFLRANFSLTIPFAYHHRDKSNFFPVESPEVTCKEFGVNFLIRARHRGMDPWLFLDLRVGRRYLRRFAPGKTVLNLFAYTCSVGITAAAAGASEVWNVDFAASSLEVGHRNAKLNHLSEDRFKMIQEDCIPVMRQLAGLPVGGRGGRGKKIKKFDQREFDLVFLDPPAWSKGAFGALDVEGDYPSLFKPALLATRPNGGKIIATNHVATVAIDSWIAVLKRCAEKAGRPLRGIEVLTPEGDFPSFDGSPPLKVVVCEV